MERGADISPDGRYRYTLWRRWAEGIPLVFVMLNPSTADANVDDPTIRRCISFAKREGFGAIEVINLYPYRATKPADLVAAIKVGDPVYDPRSLTTIWDVITATHRNGGQIVAAWGATKLGTGLVQNCPRWSSLIEEGRVKCLGVTKSGAPRHPLYVRADQSLVTWPAPIPQPTEHQGDEG